MIVLITATVALFLGISGASDSSTHTAAKSDKYSIVYDAYYPISDDGVRSKLNLVKVLEADDLDHLYRKENYNDVQALFECHVSSAGKLNRCSIRDISPNDGRARRTLSKIPNYFTIETSDRRVGHELDKKAMLAISIGGLGSIKPSEAPCVAPLCSATPSAPPPQKSPVG